MTPAEVAAEDQRQAAEAERRRLQDATILAVCWTFVAVVAVATVYAVLVLAGLAPAPPWAPAAGW